LAVCYMRRLCQKCKLLFFSCLLQCCATCTVRFRTLAVRWRTVCFQPIFLYSSLLVGCTFGTSYGYNRQRLKNKYTYDTEYNGVCHCFDDLPATDGAASAGSDIGGSDGDCAEQ